MTQLNKTDIGRKDIANVRKNLQKNKVCSWVTGDTTQRHILVDIIRNYKSSVPWWGDSHWQKWMERESTYCVCIANRTDINKLVIKRQGYMQNSNSHIFNRYEISLIPDAAWKLDTQCPVWRSYIWTKPSWSQKCNNKQINQLKW